MLFRISCLGLLICGAGSAQACTGMKHSTKDGSVVHGRTLEFAVEVDASVVVVPRGYSFVGTTSRGPGLAYKAKYAAVGAIAYNNMSIVDGMNEKGLSVGVFYFPKYASYTPTVPDNQKQSLSSLEFSNWIVTQFATIQEVKAALAAGEVVIDDVPVPRWGATAPPFHYIVFDKSGESIVIEPMEGDFVIYDNPMGVLTNSPSFDWHMINLCSYSDLSFEAASPRTIAGITFPILSQGSGMVGLPGDYTATSRFVRAALFTQAAPRADSVEDAIAQLFHLLNAFDIPYGLSKQTSAMGTSIDYTQITAVRDPHNLRYFFRTYDDQTIRVVNLQAFDLNAKEIKQASTKGKQRYINFSKQLKPVPAK